MKRHEPQEPNPNVSREDWENFKTMAEALREAALTKANGDLRVMDKFIAERKVLQKRIEATDYNYYRYLMYHLVWASSTGYEDSPMTDLPGDLSYLKLYERVLKDDY